MTAYREEDIGTKVRNLEDRLNILDKHSVAVIEFDRRVNSLEEYYKKKTSLWYVIDENKDALFAIGMAIAVIIAIGLGAQSCNAYHEAEMQHRENACVILCESMALNGGVTLTYYVDNQANYACICGNGRGDSIRVNFDGTIIQ